MTDVTVSDIETDLRLFVAGVLRRHVPAQASPAELLAEMRQHVRWLEAAWFDCHARHVRHESADGSHGLTDDGEVVVHGLVGAGFAFTQPADYELAVDLAIRAYQEGLLRAALDPHGLPIERGTL